MKASTGQITVSLLLPLLWSCSQPNLDGHYHLVWNNKGQQFQTWNIRDNRMVINDTVCQNPDSCFASFISFKGNIMTIDPWVDNTFSTNYIIDDNGTVTMYGEGDTLWLIPHRDCVTAETYFNNRTRNLTSDFQLTEKVSSSTGIHQFPSAFEHELIIGGSKDSLFYLFNNHVVRKSDDGIFGFSEAHGQIVWLHVDSRTPLGMVAPVMAELFDKGYVIQCSTLETNENDEQVILLKRPITHINKYDGTIEIETCDHCEKYPLDIPDEIVSVKMLGADSYVLNGDTNDLFQTRNGLVRYIGRNRSTRLRSQFQIEISRDTQFSDYLELIDELLWIHTEVSGIVYYKGNDDNDAEWIRKKQGDFQAFEVAAEFPIRVKEIIK